MSWARDFLSAALTHARPGESLAAVLKRRAILDPSVAALVRELESGN